MSIGFTFEIPSMIKADYKYVENALEHARLLGFDGDENDDFTDGDGGWSYTGKILSVLVDGQPQFEEIEEDDDGYKTFAGGIVTSLREAYDSVRECFDDEQILEEIDHRINGSEEAFQAALSAE